MRMAIGAVRARPGVRRSARPHQLHTETVGGSVALYPKKDESISGEPRLRHAH